ncbi:outer membrane protein [Hasllibacter sp. MH4015]|uniref:outer membrane protein n=1 Tax=Hasllibacter sp. MH4015 TaxID=2854029 RepID=UPI0021082DEA|nr:outer membrane beta-barrel protein [Hasllibacter sp. MH4015]
MSLAFTAPASAQDWSGGYAGLSFSSVNTLSEGFATSAPTTRWSGDDDTGVASIFAGYNWQLSDRDVVGVELDVALSEFGATGGVIGNPIQTLTETYSNAAALRLRYGYAVGNALPYLAVGLTSADAELVSGGSLTVSSRTRNLVGTNVALGLDYLVGNRHQLRLELRHTQFDDESYPGNFAVVPVTSDQNSYSEVRLGYAFRF